MTGFGYNINGFGVSSVAGVDRAGSVLFSGEAVMSLGEVIDFGANTAFCFEAWVYVTNLDEHGNIFSSWASASGYGGVLMHIDPDGKHFFGLNGNVLYGDGSEAVSLNTWTHYAVTRNAGSTIRHFVGGDEAGTSSSSAAASGSTMYMGANMDGGGDGSYRYHGYISNARIVVGEQVYTGDFTPATTPLTLTSQGVTSSNVKFLGCQSTTDFTANSTGTTVTAVAAADDDPEASSQSPF
tara:strand:- start:76 stop:792 length:717 start_codon:yes stop_codon:yes gene_type:complete